MGEVEQTTRAKVKHVRKERYPLSQVNSILLRRKRIDELCDALDDQCFISSKSTGAKSSRPRSSSAGVLCLVSNGNQWLYDFRFGSTPIPD